MAAVALCRSWIFRPCLFCRPASSLASRPGMDTMGPVITRSALESLTFDNQALQRLPLDGSEEPGQRTVRGACFSRVRPQPVANPRFVAVSGPALALLGLDAETVMRDPRGPEYLSGSRILPGSEPAAHCYCGHQFGNFAGQLGDGAACYLGEVPAPVRPPPGELATSPCGRWEIQLKGAGLTPYSRQADGRKVLRSSIREFLCSEAMFHLGIPTTRAGSCVTSDSRVLRDVFYSGEPRSERSTVVLRIAPSFIRFGSFEIFKPEDELTGRQGPSVGRNDIRVQLLDYVLDTFYPEIQQAHAQDRVERNSAFFREVTLRTARLVAQWQCVGFCHGVLNTDNMSILGLTVDYGPFGFMDRFDPDYVCNASDSGGRYSYSAQPEVCRWNLGKLAEALAPELPPERAQAVLEEFGPEFNSHYLSIMRRKLGLLRKELPEDKQLITLLLETMHSTGADFSNTFRALSRVSIPSCATESGDSEESEGVLQQCASLGELRAAHRPGMDPRELSMILTLAQSNPRLFQFLSSKKGVSKELERIEKLSELQEVTEAELRERHCTLWTEWLHKYRSEMGGASHLTCRVALLLCLSITASTPQNQPAQGTDCTRIKALNPQAVSGVYLIQPAGASRPFQVFCDMAAEGGWTVLQRRSGTENLSFRRGWAQYRNGFGKLHGDHWLGLEKMWSLTGSRGGRFRLRVELQDFEGGSAFADYSTFRLGSERESYRLHVGAYSGTAGDAFQGTYPGIDQNGSAFSTRDRDNDGCNPCVFGDIAMMSCSELQGGSGWWFSRCGSANLNGDWHPRGDNIDRSSGVYWKSWKGPAPYSLRASVMKVKAL